MRTFSVSAGLALVFVGTVATAAVATDSSAEAPPVVPTPLELSFGGPGCAPSDSVKGWINADQTEFTLVYDGFTAEAGDNLPLIKERTYCQVTVPIKVPAGYSYAILGAEQVGYANVAAGARAFVRNMVYFQGELAQATAYTVINGPFAGEWSVSQAVDEPDLVWSPCGQQRAINVHTALRVNKGSSLVSARSSITIDTDDFEQTYHVAWRRCPSL